MAYANIEADSSDSGSGWHLHVRDLDTGVDRPVTFGPVAIGNVDEHGPLFSPDGTQLLLWIEEGSMGRLMVAPSDASSTARVIGPPFSYDGEFFYSFSPDGQSAVLNIGKSATWLIDLASGEGKKTNEPIRNFATWQRLAQPAP